ncbi:SIR2 family protein [Aeromonas sp. A04]|uniref:SIR2 family protein n=1 Tax=Aeromonas sp. A04 TaxID=3398359 RepID=UPI0039F70F36
MKATELLRDKGELSHKLRTINDIVRHIGTREDKTANYSILLGAGASVTSGISSAVDLIDTWLIELYERFNSSIEQDANKARIYFEKEHASWYNPANPYSSLFEKKYDLPSQRRRFVESQVDKKLPSIGYAYLTSLVDDAYFNSIFTTNFDDLINEAFYQFSNQRPILCAHDSSIHSVSITSKRPKVIKLHGDYLFDDIKSTLRETESLEQNTKEKLIEFCKEYGLIVVGYSGRDRSIMDVLDFISKQENYLKNGVYWCLRPDDEVPHALRDLLWKDKIYPVIIDGFDSLFAELHEKLSNKPLGIEVNIKHSKLQSTINNIIDDKFNLSSNPIISSQIGKLKSSRESHDFSSFFNSIIKDGEDALKISPTELKNILQIEALISSKEYEIAYDLCFDFYQKTSDSKNKSHYIIKMINISELINNSTQKLYWADRLVELDSNNIGYHLSKAEALPSELEKSKYLSDLLLQYGHSYDIYNSLIKANLKLFQTSPKNQKLDYTLLLTYSDKSLNLDPSLSNEAWNLKVSIYLLTKEKIDLSVECIRDIDDKLDKHLEKARAINPEHSNYFRLKNRVVTIDYNAESLRLFISELYNTYKKSSFSKKTTINNIIDNCLQSSMNNDSFNMQQVRDIYDDFYNIHMSKNDYQESTNISLSKLKLDISSKHHDSEQAKKTLDSLINRPDMFKSIDDAVTISAILENHEIDSLEKIANENKERLNDEYYHECLSEIYTARKEYSLALKSLEDALKEGMSIDSYITHRSYILLCDKKYQDVISLNTSHPGLLKGKGFETFSINYFFAMKNINPEQVDKTYIRNLTSSSQSRDVRICAFCILNNNKDAQRLIDEAIEYNYFKLYSYQKWPIIPDDFLTKNIYSKEDKYLSLV